MQNPTIEILAPVGGHEQCIAAVRAGADAVYLGGKGFNARRNAENFDGFGLKDEVRYCHEHGVRVHCTLNILVTDDEFPACTDALDEIVEAGADAVIVQDLAVAKLVRERYPDLAMHASTQMTIHNAQGARAAEALGFTQVVLARELSIAEIASIRRETDIRLEAFVHGALCMSVSGACYLSSMIGGRSGNRGLCAQPCRTCFVLDGRAYALSLKDMSAVEHISELIDAGVTCFKIEGRMKRPEYVYASVAACKAALRGERPDMDTLRAVFSRSGFTDGYLTAKRTIDMFGMRTKDDVLQSATVLKELESRYAKEKQTIPLQLSAVIRRGEKAVCTLTDGEYMVSAEGATPEAARNTPLTQDALAKNLAQTGGTPYYIEHMRLTLDEGLSMPVSGQKQLRRDAIEALSALRAQARSCESTGRTLDIERAHAAPPTPKTRLRFSGVRQMFDWPSAEIVLPIESILREPEWIARLGGRLIAELPALTFPSDAARLLASLEEFHNLGGSDVLVGNLGDVALAKDLGLKVHGDYGLNILNSAALDEYARLGLADATVSFELGMSKIRELGASLSRGIIGYGYLPLMKLRACPGRKATGCGDCGGVRALTDSKRETFPLVCHEKRYQELLNCVPLYIGDKLYGGVDFITLRFTTESSAEARAITERFLRREAPDFERTGGLYYRTLQ